MFRTFYQVCRSIRELDTFLNTIISGGWQPWIYREQYRMTWEGWVIDVTVTSYKSDSRTPAPKEEPKAADGCKFHQS